MNTKPQWQKGLHEQLNQFSMDNPLPNTQQDLKIYQVAGYDEERVKAIRELMEEEAIRFVQWAGVNKLRYLKSVNKFTNDNDDIFTLQEFYQQSKTTLTKS